MFLLLLLIDWGGTSPTKRDILRKTEQQIRRLNTINGRRQDDSRRIDLTGLLINITESEGMDGELKVETMRTLQGQENETAGLELLSIMLEDLDKDVEKNKVTQFLELHYVRVQKVNCGCNFSNQIRFLIF